MTSNSVIFGNEEVLSAVSLMACTVVIGGIGNLLVVTVQLLRTTSLGAKWNRRQRQLQVRSEVAYSDFGTVVLAISDLFVCLIIIPSTITMELIAFRIQNDILCKLYYVLFVTNTTFSSLLISAVALDRYLYICHSLRHLLTLFRAKMLVLSLAIFSLVIGSMAGSVVSLKHVHTNITNGTSSSPMESEEVCEETEYVSNITDFQKTFTVIVRRVNHGSFLVCIIIVTILYAFVFWAIVTAHARKQRLVYIPTTDNKEPQGTYPETFSSVKIKTNLSPTGNALGQKGLHQYRRKSLHRTVIQRAHCTFQNFRSALMLFLIALVYIITFVPSLIIANGWIPQNLVLLYLYYVNSAANPCIYAAFSSSFRRMVICLFTEAFCSRDDTLYHISVGREGGQRHGNQCNVPLPQSAQRSNRKNGLLKNTGTVMVKQVEPCPFDKQNDVISSRQSPRRISQLQQHHAINQSIPH
ncbi:unnamed protein product [Schistocephalus solidus]|uniref:G_PROTEIN_RECEP_F1_2 domain-containing protein n=1 Tax=Schistocephalus solidus TaxID=70667 RepID=A0A183SFE9_SCHSO|nr:unnamed protein product [Schistocephalus solidus]